MIEFILGLPNSGKSLWAEQRMASLCRERTYVATLPSVARYQSIISRHKERRDWRWTTAELTMDLFSDFEVLKALVISGQDIFLDGVSSYLLSTSMGSFSRWDEKASGEAIALAHLAKSSERSVFVVDSPVMKCLRRDEELLLRSIHRHLCALSERIWIFADGEATMIPASVALRFSCQLLPQFNIA